MRAPAAQRREAGLNRPDLGQGYTGRSVEAPSRPPHRTKAGHACPGQREARPPPRTGPRRGTRAPVSGRHAPPHRTKAGHACPGQREARPSAPDQSGARVPRSAGGMPLRTGPKRGTCAPVSGRHAPPHRTKAGHACPGQREACPSAPDQSGARVPRSAGGTPLRTGPKRGTRAPVSGRHAPPHRTKAGHASPGQRETHPSGAAFIASS